MRPLPWRLASLLAALLTGCSGNATPDTDTADSAFAAVQERGKDVMGVDQYTSAHVFEDLPDGGRIVLDRDDPSDSAGIATIRAHMRRSPLTSGWVISPNRSPCTP